MGKKIISVLMTLMLLYGLTESLFIHGIVSAADLRVAAAAAGGGTATQNVALNAKVTASGQCNSNENARFAVDGKNDTKWCDNNTDVEIKWLKLDLGQAYTINEWVVVNAGINEGNSPFLNTKNFRLQKSTNLD